MAVLMKINNTLQSVGALRKVNNALNRTNIDLYKKEGISDLTGTSWLFNETLDDTIQNSVWNLNFSVGGQFFLKLTRQYFFTPLEDDSLWYGDNLPVYVFGEWDEYDYRTISITGGDDVTNPDLIAWLQENATQITQ